ncbi:MAG: ribosome maturation factor RimP [Myxococcales bacterium]|nr:ribosome maturation factor RimP [Myxococcales bacterium]HSG75119.1 ribosome maturation factor RimP [Burkholderiales bacterium]
MPNSLEGLLEPTLAGLGFELVDAQVSNRGRFVRIFMDKPGGITVDDCAAVSRHLSHLLEVEGIDYDRLEVSSPGMDRPLRRPADFARFLGHRVDVRMRLADATGRRRYVGVLRGIDGATATVEVDGAPVALQLEGMDRARLVPEL